LLTLNNNTCLCTAQEKSILQIYKKISLFFSVFAKKRFFLQVSKIKAAICAIKVDLYALGKYNGKKLCEPGEIISGGYV